MLRLLLFLGALYRQKDTWESNGSCSRPAGSCDDHYDHGVGHNHGLRIIIMTKIPKLSTAREIDSRSSKKMAFGDGGWVGH